MLGKNTRSRSPIYPLKLWRAPCYCLLVLMTTLWGARMMLTLIHVNDAGVLDYTIFVLFVVSFGWISTSFWSAIIGFLLLLFQRDPLTLGKEKQNRRYSCSDPIQEKTAIIMPVYNEDVPRVMAGIEATLRSLAKTRQQGHFDFYLLSDSTDEDIIRQESCAWQQLKSRLRMLGVNLFYRRREKNIHRKVGNIADFCERWGQRYAYMIVLDADSLMGGEAMVSLVHRMAANPQAGLIQTIPLPVRQQTFFGRFQQFSGTLYSRVLATGNCFWQTDSGNYWGHNAIIRVEAFITQCGLPTLVGRKPFGGEILSHDFVEAALLRRGGWQVITLTECVESYEEVPSNIVDFITRDRRWAQGNIQHLRLLGVKGFHWVSRIHLLFGAMAYLSSFLWFLMLVVGTVDAIATALNDNQFFTQPHQLFPNWRIVDLQLIYSLIGVTGLFLFFPKCLSLLLVLFKRIDFSGNNGSRVLMSVVAEMVTSVMMAPIMMTFHAYVVVCTLVGVDVTWNSQPRNGRAVRWRESLKCTLITTVGAAIWAWLSYAYAREYFWWTLPVFIGLVFAAPIVRYSGSFALGHGMKRLGLLLVPVELKPTAVVESVDVYFPIYARSVRHRTGVSPVFSSMMNTPEEHYQAMPIQQL